MSAALATTVLVVVSGCGKSSRPSPTSVIQVRGTERLAWDQDGDTSTLHFRAYVNDHPVALAAATCDSSGPQATCTSPLPPLTDGMHTISLVAVSKSSGLESEPSARLTLQKASTTGTLGAALSAEGAAGSPSPDTVVATSDGLAFALDIVVSGVKAPAQLAWDPGGRLLVAEADGRLRVFRPGAPRDDAAAALDTRALLDPSPLGPPGLVLHPDFGRNHFVYVSFLAQEAPGRTVLRIVRLREVGDTFGEPAALFEAPLTEAPSGIDDGGGPNQSTDPPGDGPRLAFGPDRLLYVALPSRYQFHEEPAASTPRASMLRLSDDGRVPLGMAALSGVVAHPVAFDWHPSTGSLWMVFRDDAGRALLRRLGARHASDVTRADTVELTLATNERLSGALRFHRTQDSGVEPARAFLAMPGSDELSVVSFTAQVSADGLLAGMFGRIGDVVQGSGGTLYLVTRNGAGDDATGGLGENVIVQLRPRRP